MTNGRKIKALLARSEREHRRGKSAFKKSGEALDQAIALGVPIDKPIKLPIRKLGDVPRTVVVVNNFDGQTVAYRPARFAKFSLEDYKEPSEKKKTKAEQAHTAIHAEAAS